MRFTDTKDSIENQKIFRRKGRFILMRKSTPEKLWRLDMRWRIYHVVRNVWEFRHQCPWDWMFDRIGETFDDAIASRKTLKSDTQTISPLSNKMLRLALKPMIDFIRIRWSNINIEFSQSLLVESKIISIKKQTTRSRSFTLAFVLSDWWLVIEQDFLSAGKQMKSKLSRT